MLVTSLCVALVMGGVLLLQIQFSRRFVSLYRRPDPTRLPDDALPEVLLVLALRGADPFLERTLEALYRLDYPGGYDLRIVVDSREDPAWPVVERSIAESAFERVQLKELRHPLPTCGLRVSALIQEFRDLDPKYAVVSWIDADVIPYPEWLRDMVTPLQADDVGAATGIRWYLPNPDGWGTVVRSMWNIGGIIQMVYFHIAFGGAMAMKAEIVRQARFLETWGTLLWEDTFTAEAMRRAGKRLEFVPQATMANKETISLASCYRFMCRQMLNVKLYHASWVRLLSFGVISSIGPYLGLAFTIWAGFRGEIAASVIAGLSVVLHVTGMILLYAWSGAFPNRVVRKRRDPNWRFPVKVAAAVPLTSFVYTASLCHILVRRHIEWRGVTYRVRGPFDITVMNYAPYHPAVANSEEEPVSL